MKKFSRRLKNVKILKNIKKSDFLFLIAGRVLRTTPYFMWCAVMGVWSVIIYDLEKIQKKLIELDNAADQDGVSDIEVENEITQK